ncbi:MAG: hypothetical protein WD066_06175 [Planctomycetaceae bacterium]
MSSTGTKPLQLSFESRQQVVVVADDEDRFVTTAGEAARACKRAADDQEFIAQFRAFLARVHEWCEIHSAAVEKGFVTITDGGLHVLLCLANPNYDFDLEDELVELDLELADDFPLCTAEVLQVPKQQALATELSSEALLVYGDG